LLANSAVSHASLTIPLVLLGVAAFAPSASAQVETSPLTEESRPAVAAPETPARPQRDPTLYGVGVTSTVVGGVALHVGGALLLFTWARGVGEGFHCAAQLGRPCPSSSDALGTVGAAMLLSGVVLLATGIPMMVIGGRRLPREAALEPLTIRF
jgi:hypothetical protein